MYILAVHIVYIRVCMRVHIGVGFGVACSDLQAIPEPHIAEQQ